jgi:catechol 2,3-dioxygenase-like lactoylglutathione lyase family enzyme
MSGDAKSGSQRRFRRLERFCLRVRDLDRSQRFYTELFGFQKVGPAHPNGCAVFHLTDPEDCELVVLELSEGLPPGTYLTGLDHVSFEVTSADMVQQVYEAALGRSVQATQPRLDCNRWRTFIFDPDGYKIEVFAPASTIPPSV